MICDKCGKEKEVWGKCVCVDCYTTSCRGSRRTSRKMDTLLINEIGYLQQQLAEKDKEIEELKNLILHLTNGKGAALITKGYLKGKEKIFKVDSLRHQVCEEIRKLATSKFIEYGDYCVDVIIRSDLDLILDRIEKGEKEVKNFETDSETKA